MSLEIPYAIKRTTAGPVVEVYGPYANVAAAKAAVLEAERFQGLTVNVAGVEYWWDTDPTDDGLVIKGLPLKDGDHALPITGVTKWMGNGVDYNGIILFGDNNAVNSLLGFAVYTNNQTLGFSGELNVNTGKIATSQEVQYEQVSERDGAGNGWRREEILHPGSNYGFQIWKGYDNNGEDNGVISIYTNTDGSSTFTNLALQIKADGSILMPNLPTSSAGLAAGTLWNDSGTIKIA